MSQLPRISFCIAAATLGLACGPSAPPPEAPTAPEPEPEPPMEELAPEPETMETGKDCATALAECDAGMCKVTVTNNCEAPITCDLSITVLCRDNTDTGEAKGGNRGTIAAGKQDVIEAAGNCEGAAMVATTPDDLSCR